MLSKRCEYGIQATLYLAATNKNKLTPIREIAERLGISFFFLTKVLQSLTERGILRSFRGPNGGVALACPADGISLKDVVVALDGPELFQECVLGLPACGEEKPCPMHAQWNEVRCCITETFESTSLATLARDPEGFATFLEDLPLAGANV